MAKEVVHIRRHRASRFVGSQGTKHAAARGTRYGMDSKRASKAHIFTPAHATDEARAIAKELHPSPEHLYAHALDLFARNTFQVFGINLDTPVDFIVCSTKDGCEHAKDRKQASGGTGQAIAMADLKGIPVFNMSNKNWFERLKAFLDLPFNLPTGILPAIPADLLCPEKPKDHAQKKQTPTASNIKKMLKAAKRK